MSATELVLLASLISSYSPVTYTYDIPEFGDEYVSFPASSTEYISAPPTDSIYLPDGVNCYQKFSYRM